MLEESPEISPRRNDWLARDVRRSKSISEKPPDYEKLKTEGNVERLIIALSHEDWKVRSEAAWALGEVKDARAVEPLIKALEDEEPFVRKATAQALGKLDDVRAVGPLIAGLREAMVREQTDDHPGWLHVRVSEHFSYYTAPITIWRDVHLTFSAVIRKFGTYAVEQLCERMKCG